MNRPDWDDQFAETEEERNARLRKERFERLKRAADAPRFDDHYDEATGGLPDGTNGTNW